MTTPKNTVHSIEDAFIDNLLTQRKSTSLVDWVVENRTVKGKKWNWVSIETGVNGKIVVKDFRYLLPIYEDTADKVIVKKGRQMAVSEFAVNWILGTITVRPYTTALHVFPNKDQGRKFSMVRLTPVFDMNDSPALARMLVNPEETYKTQSALQAAMNVFHKQLTNNSNYIISFVGGENTKSTDARSVSADIIVLDEAKDLPEEKLADVLECMSLSTVKQMRMVGTPDYEGTVFDNWFNESDRREWIVTCPKCGEKQQLTMDSIASTRGSPYKDISDRASIYYYACVNCAAELNRTADYGEWVPQNPGAKTHGYHLSQLMASWISADEIMQKKSDYSKQPAKFPNEVLGEPYEGSAKPISITKLLKGQMDPGILQPKYRYITVGVDWGDQSHFIVMGANDADERVILEYGTWDNIQVLAHANDLISLINAYGPQLVVMDSGYGKAQTQDVFRTYPDKAYACFYNDSLYLPHWETIMVDKDKNFVHKTDWQYHVTVNHTLLCDALLAEIDANRLRIPIDPQDDLVPGVSDARDMLDIMCMARVVTAESSRSATSKRRWVITKAHYFAACAYASMAMDELLKSGTHDTGAVDFIAPRTYR